MDQSITKKKVAVALSGGVDSAVAAALLKQQGFEVVGVFMQFWFPHGEKYGENRCCSLESWNEAKEIARLLDIEVFKANFGNEFKKNVVDEFLSSYKSGKTPNPCVNCNKFIKFDLLLKYAQTVLGADFLATGHYAKISRAEDGNYRLLRPADKQKDQTYFLYNIKLDQLKCLLFPLADYSKPQVRELAEKFGLPVSNKPDSQEICFVGKSHYDFLKKYLALKPGKIITKDGKQLGRHEGLALYTLGQRNGLGLSGGPWYVSGFDRRRNSLIVSADHADSNVLSTKVSFSKTNWLKARMAYPLACQAQIRSQAVPAQCIVRRQGLSWLAEFSEPQRAAAAGQSIVFYDGDIVLGGGVIK